MDINNFVRKSEIENYLANCDKHFRNLRIRAFLALAVLAGMISVTIYQLNTSKIVINGDITSSDTFREFAQANVCCTFITIILGVAATVILGKMKNTLCRKRSCNQWGYTVWGLFLLLLPPAGAAIGIASLVPVIMMRKSEYEELIRLELEKVSP